MDHTNAFTIHDDAKAVEEGAKKNPHHYRDIAYDFLMDEVTEGRHYRSYQGKVLRYAGTHYVQLGASDLSHLVRRHMLNKKIPTNNTIVGNVTPIIETKGRIEQHSHPKLPFWYDPRTPGATVPKTNPRETVAFRNGILDVSDPTLTLLPHSPHWVSILSLPYDYDPGAECPKWDAFLEGTFDGDGERIALLQEFVGYCMTADNRYQKMLVLTGASRGGKGTTSRVLQAVLGEENTTGYSLDALARQFGLGLLVGKLVALVGEVNLDGHPEKHKILQTLNSIVGDDPVQIEYKFDANPYSMTLPTRFVISCNHMPRFADDAGAFAERVMIVEYDKTVPQSQRNENLTEELKAEVSGICNWALAGLARLRRNRKFTVPGRMEKKLNDVRRQNSATLAFLQDRVVVHESLDTGSIPGVALASTPLKECRVTCSEIAEAFERWCDSSHRLENRKYLFDNLNRVLPKLKRSQWSASGARPWGYYGVRLKEQPQGDPAESVPSF